MPVAATAATRTPTAVAPWRQAVLHAAARVFATTRRGTALRLLLAALLAELVRRFVKLQSRFVGGRPGKKEHRERSLRLRDLLLQGINRPGFDGLLAQASGDDRRKAIEKAKKDPTKELREGLRASFAGIRHAATNELRTASPAFSVRTEHGVACQIVAREAQRFAKFRAQMGLSESAFWAALSEGELQCGGPALGGKSGASLWFSADRTLAIKSLKTGDLRTLSEKLGAYTQHFVSHKESLLCRIYGAFEVRVGNNNLEVMVMANIFAGTYKPHVVYDLKGTTEDRWVNPSQGAVLKDLNFADKIIGISDCRDKVRLLNSLKRDARFLRDQGIMDYSVCLGVHYCDGESGFSPIDSTAYAPGLASPLAVIRGFEPSFQCTLVRDQSARRVIYMIGIVDILQKFDWRKKLIHGVKALSLGLVHEIDTVSPHVYARRFKTSFWGKVQTFREPDDRVARFVRRLQTGLRNGTIQCPTFAGAHLTQGSAEVGHDAGAGGQSDRFVRTQSCNVEDVTIDEAIDFAVRCGGHLMLLRERSRHSFMRSWDEEVEAFFDMDRHALVYQTMSRSLLGGRRLTSAVACCRIRRVCLSIVCLWSRDRHCVACRSTIRVEAEPVESRRFTVEADGQVLRFTAPSRRQAKLWATALEVAAAYAEANVEDVEDASGTASVASTLGGRSEGALRPWALLLAMAEPYIDMAGATRVLATARPVRLGMLEPLLVGPEAERRWEKRRVKWIFTFVDADGAGGLNMQKIQSLWCELNINAAEGQAVTASVMHDDRQCRRAGGGRQIGGARHIQLAHFRGMLRRIDGSYARAVRECLEDFLGVTMCGAHAKGIDDRTGDGAVTPEALARFLAGVQGVFPKPTALQVRRLFDRLPPTLLAGKSRCLSSVGLAMLLSSPSNSFDDPAKRVLFQDMTRPLSEYIIDSSHNTYLEGNQLSSRSSVLRYVEVLRTGCRCVEVDVWDGSDGEPVVKHGYAVTTEVLFEDVMQAIADHAFVASEYPVIISIEQNCCALQRVRQGDIMVKVLGPRLLMPPWDNERNTIDMEQMPTISPWSARKRFLVKSAIGCCERCRKALPAYDRCIALPTMKLSKVEKQQLVQQLDDVDGDRAQRHACHVSSMTASKVLKLASAAGEDALRTWNSFFLSRAYPEGTRIGSGNVDPIPLWSCGVQMVAMNYQTPDEGFLLNEGIFRSYNGGCGYVLKSQELLGSPVEGCGRRRGARLRLRICCGHRLPRPEHSEDFSVVSSPAVVVMLEPGGQVSQTRTVVQDGYHPVFDHQADFAVPDSPIAVLAFEVLDMPTGLPMARRAVSVDAVREGFRWLSLWSTSGTTIPHGGLLVRAEFLGV